ncbi:hypothetical protein L9F63_028150, partial [Diploptera punctata]
NMKQYIFSKENQFNRVNGSTPYTMKNGLLLCSLYISVLFCKFPPPPFRKIEFNHFA